MQSGRRIWLHRPEGSPVFRGQILRLASLAQDDTLGGYWDRLLRVRRSVPSAEDRFGRADDVAHLPDVVDTDDGGAGGHGEGHGGRSSRETLVHRPVKHLADGGLATGADEDRTAETAKLVQTPKQFEVVLDGFSEAEARVDGDAVTTDARGLGTRSRTAQEAVDLGDHVVIVGGLLHGAGCALHVHEHNGDVACRDQGG